MQTMRVLLAARATLSRADQEAALRRFGFTVETADGGVQCLETMRWFVPEVLVLEADLPWGGGDGVLAVIRDEPSMQETPVLVLVSDWDSKAIYRMARYRISDLAARPLSANQLTWRVGRLALGKAAIRQEVLDMLMEK